MMGISNGSEPAKNRAVCRQCGPPLFRCLGRQPCKRTQPRANPIGHTVLDSDSVARPAFSPSPRLCASGCLVFRDSLPCLPGQRQTNSCQISLWPGYEVCFGHSLIVVDHMSVVYIS